jgi:hypothetical protein
MQKIIAKLKCMFTTPFKPTITISEYDRKNSYIFIIYRNPITCKFTLLTTKFIYTMYQEKEFKFKSIKEVLYFIKDFK